MLLPPMVPLLLAVVGTCRCRRRWAGPPRLSCECLCNVFASAHRSSMASSTRRNNSLASFDTTGLSGTADLARGRGRGRVFALARVLLVGVRLVVFATEATGAVVEAADVVVYVDVFFAAAGIELVGDGHWGRRRAAWRALRCQAAQRSQHGGTGAD